MDSFYKYKRRQERAQRKQTKIDERNRVFQECSNEELVLLSKIKFLMQ